MKKHTSGKLTRQVVRLDRLQEDEREGMIQEIVDLEGRIFIDTAPEKTKAKFRGTSSDEVWIMVIRDQGKLIGYNCIKVSFLESEGRKFALWNSRSGMDPDYRGLKKTGRFVLTFFFRFRLRLPTIPIRGLVTLIHPSGYRMFSSRIPNMYPSSQTELSASESSLYQVAFENLGLESVAGKAAFVVKDSTITRTSDSEADFWRRSLDPAVQFFHRHNAEYQEGQAIATYFKISLLSIFRMAYRQFKAVNPLRKWALGFGFRRGWVSRKLVLEKVPILRGLPEQEIKLVMKRLRNKWLGPGEHLFSQGEQNQRLYFVLKGSLLVDRQTTTQVYRLVQSQVGEPIGEFAFLSGGSSVASARSFRMSHVVWLDRVVLGPEMEQLPKLRKRLEKVMQRRQTQNVLTNTDLEAAEVQQIA